ncbi:MAG: heme lyase CcmF/NrfE family subunit [Alphaproteobacteria bacterium]
MNFGLSLAEIGHFALSLGLGFAVLQAIVPIAGSYLRNNQWMQLGFPFAALQFAALSVASALLVKGFILSDFSIALVAKHSHSLQPMLYKVSASWGNHEGSMLLWCLVLAFFGTLVGLFGKDLPDSLKAKVISVQAMIAVAFLLFLIFTSNPFERIVPPPLEGQSLNPLLQDPGLAFHPPLLYLGYVGLSLLYSFAIAGLLEGRVDAAFARWMRPWALISWGFLTAGIALGSWWAYYELGWGGFWFWDPVENASLMPWLAATALLHTAIVMEKRATMKSWTLLLAIIAFSLSLIGTFLVRSGVLTSVHAFATDPDRGVFILMILVVAIAGGLTLFALRAPTLKGESLFQPISREGALMLNNILLTCALATVLLGTLYPLFLDVIGGDKLSIGPPYFNATFGPLMLPLLLSVGVGGLLSWKRADLAQALRLLSVAMAFSLAIALIGAFIYDREWLYALTGLGIAGWVCTSTLTSLWRQARPHHKISIQHALTRRLWRLPGSVWGMSLAHFGLGLIVAGALGASVLTQELITRVKLGDTVSLGNYSFMLEAVTQKQMQNYNAIEGKILIAHNGNDAHYLYPERRRYVGGDMETTEAAIESSWRGDVYAVLGEVDENAANDGYVLRLYIKPLVPYMWLGSLLMVIGAGLSLVDRRLRLGVPTATKSTPSSALSHDQKKQPDAV